MKWGNHLIVLMIVLAPQLVPATNLWIDNEPPKLKPKEDQKRRMAFLERCRTQFAGKAEAVPTWCPCAYDFVVAHDYYVNYLSYKSKGNEMQVALRDFAPMIIRECGWMGTPESPAPQKKNTTPGAPATQDR